MPITRRDFLNGTLLAAGGASVSSFSPMRLFAADSIDTDPRALRSGNLPATFSVAHWIRDRRLSFSANSVTLAPSAADSRQGAFPILEDNGRYDVIIVGGGMAGLAAAFSLRNSRPSAKILILDANATFGGNASRDDQPPIPVIASTGGSYAVPPDDPFEKLIYRKIGVHWERHLIPAPMYSYYFDSETPNVVPGTHSWNLDTYGKGIADAPYPEDIRRQLAEARRDFLEWGKRKGAPSDPADASDPKYDHLSGISLHTYLTREKGWHPAVSDFYTRYSVDALAGTTEQVNAHSAISFLSSEYQPLFAFPGGNSGIARLLVRYLIPGAIPGNTEDEIVRAPVDTAELDRAGNPLRIRQLAMAVRAESSPESARVIYYHDGKFHAASAQALILAGQGHTAQRLVEHLLDESVKAAWREFTYVPVVCANVTLRNAAPLVDLGLGYNQYWWGSKYWADFVIADWVGPRRLDRNRSTVLSFYGGNWAPPEEMPVERLKLITTPFSSYEQSLREDLNRVLAPARFDFDRDATAVYIYRWGHGMVYPKIGFTFGPPRMQVSRAIRTPAPRHVARRALGRISFGAQDTEGCPSIDSAIGAGHRTAMEALRHLR